MKTNEYNPFPEVTDVVPYWVNSGTCYSRAGYLDQEVAEKVAAHVRAQGGTVNGGYMHGARLGTLEHVPAQPERPMTAVYPRRFLSDEAAEKMLPAVPEMWEVTF